MVPARGFWANFMLLSSCRPLDGFIWLPSNHFPTVFIVRISETRDRQSPDWRFEGRHSGEWRSRARDQGSRRPPETYVLPRCVDRWTEVTYDACLRTHTTKVSCRTARFCRGDARAGTPEEGRCAC